MESRKIDRVQFKWFWNWICRCLNLVIRFGREYPGRNIRRMSLEERISIGNIRFWALYGLDISTFRAKGKIQLSIRNSDCRSLTDSKIHR